jgi:hypothetical protein
VQQKSSSCDQSQSQPASEDGLQLSNAAIDDNLWECFPQGDSTFSTAPDDLSTSARHQSADPLQGAYVPFHVQSPSWELSAVGLEEPLPTQQSIDELYELGSELSLQTLLMISRHQIFFEKIYPGAPFIHMGRYLAAISLPATSRLRPPVCLSYAIWCLAASVSESYSAVTEHFYHRARKYMEIDEIAGRGQGVVTLAHAQATAYLATFESRMSYFPRAWLSLGRAVRLCHMMNLHRVDGGDLAVKEMLSSASSWVDLEERRRVFWAVFVQDRYQSVGSGWPTIMDERDVSFVFGFAKED